MGKYAANRKNDGGDPVDSEAGSSPVAIKGSPTVRRRRLGAELRKHRKASKVSVETVAEEFDVTPSTIYRMELGRVGVKSRDIELFVKLYKITNRDLIKELTVLAKDGSKRGWWAKYTDTISPPYATYVGLEADATRLCIYDGLIINGLLQNRAYAEATFDFADSRSKEHMSRRIDLRMERQQRLQQKNDFQLWDVIDEAAIRRVVGGKQVMRAQLEHLLDLSQLSNVTLQVLPFEGGAYPGMLGSFTLMEFGGGEDPEEPDPEPDPSYRHPDVVYIEGHTADVYEEEQVEPFRGVFENLRAAALSPALSLELISEAAGQL
jgi:transcriptional regulator with XRE-family HTH domain